MNRDFPVGVSAALTRRLADWLEKTPDERLPVTARPASTVMVVRDRAGRNEPASPGKPAEGGSPPGRPAEGGSPVEVFMLHRVSTMAFAPDTLVFPGGGVDPRDGDETVPWRGANDVLWAGRLGCTAHQAREFVCAAVRELFEETGVLLAGPKHGDELVDSRDWQDVRAALESREISLAHLLRERGLVLRSDLMRAESHWITPVFEGRHLGHE